MDESSGDETLVHPLYTGIMISLCKGTMISLCAGFTISLCAGFTIPLCAGITISLYAGIMISLCKGITISYVINSEIPFFTIKGRIVRGRNVGTPFIYRYHDIFM